MYAPFAFRLIPTLVVLLTLSAVPSEAASAGGPALDRGWTSSSIAVPPTGMALLNVKVVAGGPGLLALGTEANESMMSPSLHTLLWTSADGLTWNSVPLSPDVFPETAQVRDMAAGPHGIVITGSIGTKGSPGPSPPVFWHSADGMRWQTSSYANAPDSDIFYIQSVAAGANGFVAAGTDIPPPTSSQQSRYPTLVVLTSLDGQTWQRVPDPQTIFANVFPTAVVAGGPGYVLVGSQNPPANPSSTEPPRLPHAVAYTSPDGLTWSGPYLLPQAAGSDESHVFSLTAGQGVLAGLGSESGPTNNPQRIWISNDGAHWQESPWRGTQGANINSIAALGRFLVGIGGKAGRFAIWYSSDGLQWTQAGDDRAFNQTPGHQAGIQAIVGFGDGLEAIGNVFSLPNLTCGFPPGGPQPPPKAPPLVAWRWTPQSSQAAPPPAKPSPLDPRTFSLRLSDLPRSAQSTSGQHYSALCSFSSGPPPSGPGGPIVTPGPFSPALGKYAAFLTGFQIVHASGAWAETVSSITIVAESDTTAHAAILQAAKYFSPAYAHPGKPKEQRLATRIGTETRLFATHSLVDCGQEDCLSTVVPASGVIWRQGRDIGIVIVYGTISNRRNQTDALHFAAAQDAHLRASSAHRHADG